jgi:hypothetical protein
MTEVCTLGQEVNRRPELKDQDPKMTETVKMA